jgi:signal peptidase I
MEPTIEVGDRILVNKMAYALQLPLSGPKLGVPFTGLQWDNPLDFLPQFKWGTPRRFDIVTFWNPVSGRRMVKRIVAEPGDTIQMRGGILTINGETANYTDVTPTDQTPTTRLQSGGNAGAEGIGSQFQTVPLEYLQETLLGAERTIQHIKVRWLDTPVVAVFANGAMATLNDEGRLVVDPSGRTMTPEEFAATEKTSYQLLQVREGATFVDEEPASYNEYAEAYLKPLADQRITLKSGEVIEIDGHELVLNNETVSHEVFLRALQGEFPGGRIDRGNPAGQLYLRMDHLGKVLLTSFGPVTLDEGQYYMVGDNRNNSHDSRFFGPVYRGEITGEAFAVAASFNGRILQLPPDPDWGRWFMGLD